MAKAASSLQLIRRVVEEQRVRQLSDHDLVQRFDGQGDEAAFRTLLLRHGPMVLEVCLGVLGNEADAEDAFQVTFLILAKKLIVTEFGVGISRAKRVLSSLVGGEKDFQGHLSRVTQQRESSAETSAPSAKFLSLLQLQQTSRQPLPTTRSPQTP